MPCFGTNVRWNNQWQCAINYQHPLNCEYANQEVAAQSRWAVKWSYSF
ncbi:MAG: hypothetical protein AAF960_21475 [Bacteroidota bacterium]